MIKNLVKHGNSQAIVIDKLLLEAAGITEKTRFQISISPNGGLLIQSVDDSDDERIQEVFNKLDKKYEKLMKRLADL